jgi:hypothetical protein
LNIQTVLIVCDSDVSAFILQNKLEILQNESQGAIDVEVAAMESAIERIDDEIGALAMKVHAWTPSCAKFIDELRVHHSKIPVVMETKLALPADFERNNEKFANILFVHGPTDDMFRHLIRHAIENKGFFSRKYVRVTVHHPARVVHGDNKSVECLVVNISKGGVGVVFKNYVPISPGQIVTLQIDEGDNEGAKVRRGEVAWTNRSEFQAGINFKPNKKTA